MCDFSGEGKFRLGGWEEPTVLLIPTEALVERGKESTASLIEALTSTPRRLRQAEKLPVFPLFLRLSPL